MKLSIKSKCCYYDDYDYHYHHHYVLILYVNLALGCRAAIWEEDLPLPTFHGLAAGMFCSNPIGRLIKG